MDASQLLESINQNINEGIYRSNSHGLIYVNKAFAKMFGYSSEEEVLSTNSITLYKHPEDRQRMVDLLLANDAFENEETVFLKKDGSEFIGLISSTVYIDPEGNSLWDGAIRDVTEHRAAIKQAQSNNRLLETINKNINEGIYRSIKGKGMIYANDEFVRMFGYDSVEEIHNVEPTDLYKYKHQRGLIAQELKDSGSITNREIELKRKDGSTFWGYLSSIQSVEGGITYFDGAIRDMTSQKESEEALKYYAEMQNVLINLSSKYINLPIEKLEESMTKSLEELGLFVSADRAYIFEYYLKEGQYSNTFEWCREGITPMMSESQNLEMKKFPSLIKNHLKGQPVFIHDVSSMKEISSRELLEMQDIKSLITVPLISDNACIGFIGFDSVRNSRAYSDDEILLLKVAAEILVNTLNRSKSQKQLELLLETANSQNKRLKDFSYITSHNFRSSVANLMGLTQMLEDNPGDPDYFEMLKTTTYKLSQVIDNINELLNFENEVDKIEQEDCNLVTAIESVIELNNQILRENAIEVIVDVDQNLSVRATSAYLVSIFHNLITNAIKYGTTEGSKKIHISAKKSDKELLVMIKDHGLGIDLGRFKDKMFKLGSRFHSKENDGQGLGLYMTKQQIEAMGGRIDLESEVNSGTTFKIYFNG